MHRVTRLLALAVLAPVVATMTAITASAAPGHDVAVTAAKASSGVHPVAGSYIVVLRPGADAHGLAKALQVNPAHYYDAALNGFAADLTPGQLRALSRNADVRAIE